MTSSVRAQVEATGDGCYAAARAAALSGVPRSTLYSWARAGVVVPSVSPTREKLWSYADLMGLRIVSWLRHNKPEQVPASPMPRVRRALELLAQFDFGIWDSAARDSPLMVDATGEVYVRNGREILNSLGQPMLLPEQSLALTAPFTAVGLAGPDLIAPRAHLRIVPAKVAGEPHIEGSRITTLAVAALGKRGYSSAEIAAMYDVSEPLVLEALDLERQLARTGLVAA